MRYSQAFERDFAWYTKWASTFNFDGSAAYFDKHGNSQILETVGFKSADAWHSAKECFYVFDSQGKIIPTHEADLLRALYKCKGSINFMLKAWAEGRADGTLPRCDWEAIQQEFELLAWMVEAVENQYRKLL